LEEHSLADESKLAKLDFPESSFSVIAELPPDCNIESLKDDGVTT
jgi:hypothetical protein